MILKISEKKRGILWKIIMYASTIVLIVVAAYFLLQIFYANPIKGSWYGEDLPIYLKVRDHSSFQMEYTADNGEKFRAKGSVEIDRDNKEVTLHFSPEQYKEAAADKNDEWKRLMEVIDQSYSYSVQKNSMELTDREYGETYIFSDHSSK